MLTAICVSIYLSKVSIPLPNFAKITLTFSKPLPHIWKKPCKDRVAPDQPSHPQSDLKAKLSANKSLIDLTTNRIS